MNNLAPTYNEFMNLRPNSNITSDEYETLVLGAEAWVDEYIYPNEVVSTSSALSSYKATVAAIVEFDYEYPNGVASHYSAGKVSETLDSSQTKTAESEARKYLSGSGLLCRWL